MRLQAETYKLIPQRTLAELEHILYPLITKDPITAEPLIVTRLQGPGTGIIIEGQFSLGWIGRLTADQLSFVEVLIRQRGNLQRVAAELTMSYNTARSRMDEIADLLGTPEAAPPPQVAAPDSSVLDQLAAGTLSFDEAMHQLRGQKRS